MVAFQKFTCNEVVGQCIFKKIIFRNYSAALGWVQMSIIKL